MILRRLGPATLRAAKLSGFASFLLLTFVVLAASQAKADTIFDVNANVLTGSFAGTDVFTGTIDINTVTGIVSAIDLTLTNDASLAPFTTIGGGHSVCASPSCVYFSNNAFANFGQLVLGNLIGYTGGILGSTGGNSNLGSFIDIGSKGFYIDGTVTPETSPVAGYAAAPEPSSFILMGLGMIGLLFFAYRKGLLQGM